MTQYDVVIQYRKGRYIIEYENFAKEMNRGYLQLLVMVLLQESMYGYQIVRELEKRNYIIEENTLYPLLRRLNNKKILQSNWEIVEGKPRKYYQISEDGKKVLEKLIDIWLRQNQLLKNLLGGSKDV